MPFYFPEKHLAASYAAGTSPRLISVFQTLGEPLMLPRVMHKHDDCLELVLIREGGGQYTIDGRTYQTGKGDILVYNAGTIHDESVSLQESTKVYYCSASHVSLKGLEPNHLIARGAPAVIHSGDQLTTVEALFAAMIQQVALKTAVAGEIAQQILAALLLLVHQLGQKQLPAIRKNESELGQKIKDYLDREYQSDLTLAGIAEVFHINQYYLAHLFKEYTGYSPLQYLIRRRIGEAQSMLIDTDLSVRTIATEVGFNHLNHFHHSFMKVVGMAPGRYRHYWHDPD